MDDDEHGSSVGEYSRTEPSEQEQQRKARVLVMDEALTMVDEEAWKQLPLGRYRIPAPEMMTMYVEPSEGHDDFLMSIALLTEALSSFVELSESG